MIGVVVEEITKFDQFIESINEAAANIHTAQVEKGFWDEKRDLSQVLLLIISELVEMYEGVRNRQEMSEKIPDFTSKEEETADAVIRLLDFAGSENLRLGEAIKAKLIYNQSRGHKHGKEF